MFENIIPPIINTIANTGMTKETEDFVIDVLDTILSLSIIPIEDRDSIYTLIDLLDRNEKAYNIDRLISELKPRMLREKLGLMWRHGPIVKSWESVFRNMNLATRRFNNFLYEDGTCRREIIDDIHNGDDNYIDNEPLNDMALLLFDGHMKKYGKG